MGLFGDTMKRGEIYFYDHEVAKRVMIHLNSGKEFYDIGRMGVYYKSLYAIYSLVAPSSIGVWNDDC